MNDNVRIESELARLQEYLRDWAHTHYRWRPESGLPGRVPYLSSMRPGVADSSEMREGPNPWAMGLIEACINDLCKVIPEAMTVLLSRYLNREGPAVYRMGRLSHLDSYAVDVLADKVEFELVPMVKRKGLPL